MVTSEHEFVRLFKALNDLAQEADQMEAVMSFEVGVPIITIENNVAPPEPCAGEPGEDGERE